MVATTVETKAVPTVAVKAEMMAVWWDPMRAERMAGLMVHLQAVKLVAHWAAM